MESVVQVWCSHRESCFGCGTQLHRLHGPKRPQ